MPKRVHEIAKERGLQPKDVLDRLRAAGMNVKAVSSAVDEAAALKALGNGGAIPAASAPAPAKAKTAPTGPGAAKPAPTQDRDARPAQQQPRGESRPQGQQPRGESRPAQGQPPRGESRP